MSPALVLEIVSKTFSKHMCVFAGGRGGTAILRKGAYPLRKTLISELLNTVDRNMFYRSSIINMCKIALFLLSPCYAFKFWFSNMRCNAINCSNLTDFFILSVFFYRQCLAKFTVPENLYGGSQSSSPNAQTFFFLLFLSSFFIYTLIYIIIESS